MRRRILAAALLLLVLPVPTLGQGFYSTAGYSLAGARGTIFRNIDGAMVNPALLGLPGRKPFSVRLANFSVHFDQNLMGVERWNRIQGTHLTEEDKQEILDTAGTAIRLRGSLEADAIGVQIGGFSFGSYLFLNTEGRIPSTFLEIALRGTELDRTYQLNEIGVRTEAVSVFQATYALRLAFLERFAQNLLLPVSHINGGIGLKYYLGHFYAGDGDGQADLYLGYYGLTGVVDYTYRTAGIPGGTLDEDSSDPAVIADDSFGVSAGSGIGLDLGMAMELDNGFSFHGALLNISPGITWNKSTYEARVLVTADTISIGDAFEFGGEEAADLDSLSSTDVSVTKVGSFRSPVPTILRLGATYRYGRLAVNAEFEHSFSRAWGYNRVPRIGFGIEFRPLGFLPLRAGMSIGGRTGTMGAIGFGLDFKAIVFDLGVGNTGLTPGGVRGLGFSTGLKFSW